MKIENRIISGIQSASEKDFATAMNFICPAIEASARKALGKGKVSASEFKDFIRRYYWCIERFAGEGLNLVDTRFPTTIVRTDSNKVLKRPDFADLIYHFHRCALAHGHEIQEGFEFIPVLIPGVHYWKISTNGESLSMPSTVVWALIALVVFCRENSDISTICGAYLTFGVNPTDSRELYRFDLDMFWGQEEIVKKLFLKLSSNRILLNFD